MIHHGPPKAVIPYLQFEQHFWVLANERATIPSVELWQMRRKCIRFRARRIRVCEGNGLTRGYTEETLDYLLRAEQSNRVASREIKLFPLMHHHSEAIEMALLLNTSVEGYWRIGDLGRVVLVRHHQGGMLFEIERRLPFEGDEYGVIRSHPYVTLQDGQVLRYCTTMEGAERVLRDATTGVLAP